ncbi:hypothetical protein NW765_008685 [Fusarium oxysporum]|nr:hypothetical protein NW765_008685 [Fusarium oxysporum]KAJ4283063.1 hypothetical protein NW764_002474 [Fusarium oxysporum]
MNTLTSATTLNPTVSDDLPLAGTPHLEAESQDACRNADRDLGLHCTVNHPGGGELARSRLISLNVSRRSLNTETICASANRPYFGVLSGPRGAQIMARGLGPNASESRAGKERFKSNVWKMLDGLLSLLLLSCRSHASCCEKLDIKHTHGLCLSLIHNMIEPNSKLPRAFIQSPGDQRDSVTR